MSKLEYTVVDVIFLDFVVVGGVTAWSRRREMINGF